VCWCRLGDIGPPRRGQRRVGVPVTADEVTVRTGGRSRRVGWTRALTVGAAPGLESRLIRPDLGGYVDRDAYVAAGGYAEGGVRGEDLIEAVELAGLRGRGGAAFPTAVKMRSVRDRPGPRYLVANGEEGEPASVKDRWLLRHRPHLVLDGLLRTAEAVGVERAYVFVSDRACAAGVEHALGELVAPAVPIEVVFVDPTYVAGEETAVVRALEGGPALPLDKPPRPFEVGVKGQPTLIANVETLANVPFVAVEGPKAYRQVGTSGSPGTFLLTISGDCRRPGLYEVPLGIVLRDALNMVGAPVSEACAILMGGFFGGILSPRVLDVPLAYDELREEGSGLGCGSVIVLGADDCPVAAVADVMNYFARENANQCGACIRGTPAMRDAVMDLARGTDDTERLRRWSLSLRGRGACGLLDGAAALAASLLREFPEVVQEHLDARCARCADLIGPDTSERTRFRLPIDDPEENGELVL